MPNLKISYNPDKFYGSENAGVKSQLSWKNIKPNLSELFGLKPDEELVGLTVDQWGIRAHIEKKST